MTAPLQLTLTETERLALLADLIGTPNQRVRPFANAIRAVVKKSWDRDIVPLCRATWPELLGSRTGWKLEFLACKLYATAPYTVLFCSPRRPRAIGVATWLGEALRLPPEALARLGALAVHALGAVFPPAEQTRIVVTGMFIATIDHVWDHCLSHLSPQAREAHMKALLAGTTVPDTGPTKLVVALHAAMQAGLDAEEQQRFRHVIDRVIEWIESEVKGMTGVPDPTGQCWRTAGVLGTIDGLIFPVHGYAGEGAREWMYGVSLFCQIMDDWIDADQDRKDVRITPVLTGRWTIDTVRESFHETLAGIEALAVASGLTTPHYRRFVRDVYQWMAFEVMEAMVKGTAA